MYFFLAVVQLKEPFERSEGTEFVGVFMKVDRCCLKLGQSEGYHFCRIFQPLQVRPRSPEVTTAKYSATLLKGTAALFSPARLYYRVEPHPGPGDEKFGKKSFGVLPAQYFCLSADDNYYAYPHIFQTFGVPVTAARVTMDHQRMHFSTQTTGFCSIEELQKLYK